MARILALLLAIGTLAVYWPARQFEFINYDDQDYVYGNPMVMRGLTAEGVRWAFTTRFAANWHPLTWLSHMLDCELYGARPGAHHMMNVLLHTLATAALFFALLRLTRLPGRSAIVAALFALHPLHVESVAWVAERKDVLSGLFWMLALWAYAWYVERPGIVRYLLVLAAFVLGLLAKPMLVTLPFVLLLLDYWPLRRLNWRWNVTEKLPLFTFTIASSVITFLVQRNWGAMDAFKEPISFPARMANALVAYVSYLGKTFLPEDLSVLYPHPLQWPIWIVTGAALLLIFITVVVVIFGKARPYLITGWLWFLGTLVPVIGLVQVGEQYMADRYTYIPLVGIFIALVWFAGDALARSPRPRLASAVAVAIVLMICVVGTRRQLGYWQNSVKLFARAVQITRNNSTAHYNLGQALSMRERHQEALPHYQEAVRIKPEYPEALNNLGFTLALLGRLPEGTNYYEKALRLDPRLASAHVNYGFGLLTLERPRDALKHFEAALENGPADPLVLSGCGRALLGVGQVDDAIRRFRQSIELQPDYAESHFYLGLALLEKGEADAGLKEILRAAELDPHNPEIRLRLGMIYASQGETLQAIAQYKEALRLRPDYPIALNNYAWLLATHPSPEIRNGVLAVELAERACDATKHQVPLLIGTLAAAYAEAGRFEEAVRTAEKARELAASQKQDAVVKKNDELIKLYTARKPYRE